MIIFDIIRSRKEFIEVRKQWDQLWECQTEAWPTLSWTWFDIFWSQMELSGWDAIIPTALMNGDLVAAAPLMMKKTRRFGFKYYTVAGLENAHSMSYNWLMPPDLSLAAEAMKGFLSYFEGMTKGKHIITWKNGYSDHETTRVLIQLFKKFGYRVVLRVRRHPPVIEMPGERHDLLASLSRNMRRRLKRGWKHLKTHGTIRFSEISAVAGLVENLERCWSLENDSWKGEKGTSILANSYLVEFYNLLAVEMSNQSRLALFTMTCEDDLVAFCFCLRNGDSLYALKSGINWKYAQASPMYLLLQEILGWMESKRMVFFHLGGEADEFKLHWTNHTHEVSQLFAFPGNIYGKMMYGTSLGWKEFLEKHISDDTIDRARSILFKDK